MKMDYWIISILHVVSFANVYGQQFFNTMPPPVNTSFTCRGRDTGLYADIETNCRVYHTCDENGNKFTYYCPAETAFRQEALVCDHAHLVDCQNGRRISRIKEIVESKDKDVKRVKNNERYSSSYSSRGFLSNSAGKIVEKNNEPSESESSNSAYTRSFKITQEPRSRYAISESSNAQKPTFVLSSSVFLRDRVSREKNNEKRQPIAEPNNRAATIDILQNSNHSESSLEKGLAPNEKKESGGPSRTFSSTTTLPAYVTNFRAKGYFLDPMIFRSSTFNKFEESTKSHADEFSSTTAKIPLGHNYRLRGQSDDNRRFDKSKLNYENSKGNAESPAGRTDHFDTEKISFSKAPIEVRTDEKRLRDKKIESNNFRGYATIGETTFDSDSRGRNQEEVDEFFVNMSKNSTLPKNWGRSDKNAKDEEISIRERPPFFYDNSNFPYSETLRSMQAITETSTKSNSAIDKSNRRINSSVTTSSPLTTAGTEFPVHPLGGTFLPLGSNGSDDDPYYPKRPTTTEMYYKIGNQPGEEKRINKFSTKRPWPSSLNFEIPEVLPDLNTLDDLVDRRKIFYIPRIKSA